MTTADAKLKEALLKCLYIDKQNLEKEMTSVEEHIFSDYFVEKMEN